MASNLRVDSIVPATGSSVSIGTATGGVSIPGVLTYEDVTNVDSVGVITARSGINVTSGSVGINTVSGNEKLDVFGAIRVSGSSAEFNAGLQGALVDYDLVGNAARFGHVNGASGSAKPVVFVSGGTERLRIDSNGHTLPGTDNTSDLGSSSKRWRNIYSADLQLSNVGTGGNEVDGTEGKWTLQEAEDTVYMINRITGKRYKIKMEEV